jgi:hypothetical protein
MEINEVKILDALERRIADPSLLEFIGARALSLVQKNIKDGGFAPNSALTQAVKGNNIPMRDRGIFLSSFFYSALYGKAIVWTNAPQARILHDGGVIRPRNAKFLTIPAGAKTRTLMRKYGLTPRTCIDGMKSAGWRVWTYFGTGTPVICASYKSQIPFVLFILKRSVAIPPRPFMRLPQAYIDQLTKAVERRIFA